MTQWLTSSPHKHIWPKTIVLFEWYPMSFRKFILWLKAWAWFQRTYFEVMASCVCSLWLPINKSSCCQSPKGTLCQPLPKTRTELFQLNVPFSIRNGQRFISVDFTTITWQRTMSPNQKTLDITWMANLYFWKRYLANRNNGPAMLQIVQSSASRWSTTNST